VSLVDGHRSTMSMWMLHLDSELLFTCDAGITEPSAASRRGTRIQVSVLNALNGLADDIQYAYSRHSLATLAPAG
jgi:hypothetical protein